MIVDGIEVVGGIPEQEARAYADRAPRGTYRIEAEPDGAFVDLTYYTTEEIPFERIRRITGYLVGDLNRFNDAKRAEVADRVKHGV